jgi:hypothetical protein
MTGKSEVVVNCQQQGKALIDRSDPEVYQTADYQVVATKAMRLNNASVVHRMVHRFFRYRGFTRT